MKHRTKNTITEADQFFTAEAGERISKQLLQSAIEELHGTIKECLKSRPIPDSITFISVNVCGEQLYIPYAISNDLRTRMHDAVERLKPFSREDIPHQTVNAHRELFAALFAWGYLLPENEWNDQIKHSYTGESIEATNEAYVVSVVRNFLSGNEAQDGVSWIAGNGNIRLCYDTNYQGSLERILCNLRDSDLNTTDRMVTAELLLKTYPSLTEIHEHPKQVLEAVIGFIGDSTG
ncbi:hypothetical protein KKF55_06590 [Patescibacteria group bacterium]|nr:hypothetical protein [Patescibacteria group bacterium]